MGKRPVFMELDQNEVAQVYSFNLPKAQQQCIYLMRKRWSLERAIEDLQKKLALQEIRANNAELRLAKAQEQAATQLRISNENVERLNATNQEHIAEIQRLEAVIKSGNLG